MRPPSDSRRVEKVRFPEGTVLLVEGPASVEVLSSNIGLMGILESPGSRVLVRRNKILPFEIHGRDEGEVIISLGSYGEFRLETGRVGTAVWDGLWREISSGEAGRIIVVGETDTGKTTLTTYLANRALSSGLSVGVVDGDIGQSDLSPPGCVGSAWLKSYVRDLRDLAADHHGFVGFTTPSLAEELVMDAVMDGVRELAKRRPDLTLVNTDGYVTDGGVDYKISMIGRIDPDLVILTSGPGSDDLAGAISAAGTRRRTIRAEAPERLFKSRTARSQRRVSQYHRFLREMKPIVLDVSGLDFNFCGRRYRLAGTPRMEVVDSREPWILQEKDLLTVSSSCLFGMFLGLGDGKHVRGFGVGRGMEAGRLRVLSPLETRGVDSCWLSSIRLSFPKLEEEFIPFDRKV